MDKKKILIIVGVVAVAGIGFYLWNKSKKTAETGGAEGGAETKAPADAETKSADASEPTATAKKSLTKRKDKKKACGRKPLNKKKIAEWQKCVDAGGTASFEGDDYSNVISENFDLFAGDFDGWQNDYIDFEGEVDNQFMFSEFENNLNLDL